MIGNDHVRFGPGAAGKGPARCGHLASGLPVHRRGMVGSQALQLGHRAMARVAPNLPIWRGQRSPELSGRRVPICAWRPMRTARGSIAPGGR